MVVGVIVLVRNANAPVGNKNQEFLKTQQKRSQDEPSGRYLSPPPLIPLGSNRRKMASELIAEKVYQLDYDFENYPFEIVGEGSYQSNLKKIAGPKEEQSKFYQCSAKVTSEPTNKFDKNAIKVEINGLLVGYLSREDAQKLVGRKINKVVAAVIDGGWYNSDDEGSYGVKLGINNVSDLI